MPNMMKRHQFQEAIDRARNRVPFQPFVIELDEGGRLTVEKPEQFPCFAGAGLYLGGNGGDLHFVDPEDVHQVVELTPAPQGQHADNH
jgi:hypothetical protein